MTATTIPALTIRRPYIDLMLHPDKPKLHELRQRRTKIRGIIALHSSKSTEQLPLCNVAPFNRYVSPETLVSGGHVVGLAHFTRIFKAEEKRLTTSKLDLTFGWWNDYRYAYEINVIHRFAEPIPARGNVMFWQWQVPTEHNHLVRRLQSIADDIQMNHAMSTEDWQYAAHIGMKWTRYDI